MDEARDADRAAGAVIVGGFDGTAAPRDLLERIARGHLAGVTLFARNIVDVEQVAALCAQLVDAAPAGLSPVISIDQEGGRVARLRSPVPQLPAMRVLGSIGDPALTARAARALGGALGALGVNLDFAPVADVDSNPANPVIGDRSFGRDAGAVSLHVAAFIQALQQTGVLACAKHFPGHGDTSEDSHLALPRVTHPRSRIDAVELPPFRAAIGAGVASIMTAHVVFDALAQDVPATMSPAVVRDLLRGEMGFEGVCFSDDLHMNAVRDRYSIENAAVAAIEAGCDGLLICTDLGSQDRARTVLADRARRDLGFAARLHEAAGRMDALRRRAPSRPERDAKALRATLADAESDQTMHEIARRYGGP